MDMLWNLGDLAAEENMNKYLVCFNCSYWLSSSEGNVTIESKLPLCEQLVKESRAWIKEHCKARSVVITSIIKLEG